MNFEWDETKRLGNLNKHKINFPDIVEGFKQHRTEYVDKLNSSGELRYNTLMLIDGNVIVVTYTYRDNWHTIRVISARKSSKKAERKWYNKTL